MFYLVIVDTRQTKKIACMRNVLLIPVGGIKKIIY